MDKKLSNKTEVPVSSGAFRDSMKKGHINMKQEVKSVLKKTARIAGVTCLTAGSIAVLTSGVALKAISEGGKYLAGTVKRIIEENERIVDGDVAAEEDFAMEDVPQVQESI